MTQAQRIINNWLVMQGFTISCSDIVPEPGLIQEVQKLVEESEQNLLKDIELFQDKNKLQEQKLHKIGKRIFDSFEFKINTGSNEKIRKAEKAVKEKVQFTTNNFFKMIWAGSKGKATNMAQVTGIVGQQNIEGARISFGFNRRTLPHFSKDDHGLESRGFVKSNFWKGLNPNEFFFHTMGGREGLSDTAVKTSRTGYI